MRAVFAQRRPALRGALCAAEPSIRALKILVESEDPRCIDALGRVRAHAVWTRPDTDGHRWSMPDQRRVAVDEISARALQDPAHDEADAGIVAASVALRAVLSKLRIVARTETPLLFAGEPGCGKTTLGRAVHRWSDQGPSPLLEFDCARTSDAEAALRELSPRSSGRLRAPTRGSILLKEVGALPSKTQRKLSGAIARQSCARVLATSARDLVAAVERGRFSNELYHQLLPVQVPPLRERTDDIGPLAERFLQMVAARLDVDAPRLSEPARRALLAYPWPGNVRELGSTMERALILSAGRPVDPCVLGLPGRATARARPDATRLAEDEIVRALEANMGVIKHAAEALGVSRQALYRRMDVLGLTR